MADFYFSAGSFGIIITVAVTIRELYFVAAICSFYYRNKTLLGFAIHSVNFNWLLKIHAQQVGTYITERKGSLFLILQHFIFISHEPCFFIQLYGTVCFSKLRRINELSILKGAIFICWNVDHENDSFFLSQKLMIKRRYFQSPFFQVSSSQSYLLPV